MLLSFTLIHWLRTIFLMPMERCPTDKPLGYNVLDHTLFSYYCRNGNDESKEMAQKTAEEPGFKIPYDEPDVVQDAVKSTRSLKDENISLLEIAKELGKEIFTIRMAGLALWYAVVRKGHNYNFEENIKQIKFFNKFFFQRNLFEFF